MASVCLFMGDRFVDATGADVTSAIVKYGASAEVLWPVSVRHAPCHRYLDTEIVEQDGPEYLEFVASSFEELDAHQDEKW